MVVRFTDTEVRMWVRFLRDDLHMENLEQRTELYRLERYAESLFTILDLFEITKPES